MRSATCLCFDTVNTITIESVDSEPLRKAVGICDRLEFLLSRFRPGSDIWQLNHADGKYIDVDEWTEDIVKKSVAISGWTDGAFDISMGAVCSEWKFGREESRIPTDEVIREKLKSVDYRKIWIADRKIRILKDMKLDLGGIAKGYAADLITAMLIKNDVVSGIVNLGGNIGVIGQRTDGEAWQVGIVDPTDKARALGSVKMSNQFLSVSGVYERYIKTDHSFYHHLLDVETGLPVKNNLLCVAVLSDNGAEGDAISTACMCMGFDKAIKFLDKCKKVEALFAFQDHTVCWYGEPEHISISEKWRRREWKGKS